MSFKLTIENFGRLTEAEIRIGQFTVFAGPNNTGKSFVSKLLYSLFDVMNADHAGTYFNRLFLPISTDLSRLVRSGFAEESKGALVNIDSLTNRMENFFGPGFSDHLEELWPEINFCAKELKAEYGQLETKLNQWRQKEGAFLSTKAYENTLERMKDNLDRLCSALLEDNPEEFAMKGIKQRISDSLVQNFQTRSLSNLRKEQNQPTRITLNNVGEFTIKNTKSVDFNVKDKASFYKLQEHSGVIYLESPLYWKLKSALEEVKLSPRFRFRRGGDALSGVPGYFYDLARALRVEYLEGDEDDDFMEIYKRLTEAMEGKLAVSETGELRFEDNKHGTSLALHLVAMGVVNLGILALLIERRIINEDSFLFIDEPEAHLHPYWQVEIAETLWELSRLGVKVVIATHSVDILKFLEEKVRKNPESEDLIALNRFSPEGIEGYAEDFNSKLNAIQENLTKPFADLFLKGL